MLLLLINSLYFFHVLIQPVSNSVPSCCSELLIYGLMLVISQSAISSSQCHCCWTSTKCTLYHYKAAATDFIKTLLDWEDFFFLRYVIICLGTFNLKCPRWSTKTASRQSPPNIFKTANWTSVFLIRSRRPNGNTLPQNSLNPPFKGKKKTVFWEDLTECQAKTCAEGQGDRRTDRQRWFQSRNLLKWSCH